MEAIKNNMTDFWQAYSSDMTVEQALVAFSKKTGIPVGQLEAQRTGGAVLVRERREAKRGEPEQLRLEMMEE